MQSSNMVRKRPKGRPGYGPSGSSRPGRTASGHGEAGFSASCARASAMAARSSSEGCGVISSFTATQAKVARARGRWELSMGRRLLALTLLPALVFAGAATAAGSKPVSWDPAQIRAVTAAGLMDGTSVATFRAGDPLTAHELENLAFALQQRLLPIEAPPPIEPPVVPTVPTTTTTTSTTTTTAPTTTTEIGRASCR